MSRFLSVRRVISVIVVLAVVGAGATWFVQSHASSITYRTVAASMGTVTQTVDVSGTIAVSNEYNLDFGGSARVNTVNVAVGDQVTAGQVLATQDTSSFAAGLAQAQGQVASAQQQESAAQTSYTDSQAINSQSLTADQTAVTTATNQVNADNAQLAADTAVQNSDCGASPSGSTCISDQAKVAGDNSTLTRDQGTLTSAQSALTAQQLKVQQGNDQAAASLAASKVSLANAEASLNASSNQTYINEGTLTAPAAGVVAEVNIAAGQTSGPSSGSSGGGSASAGSGSTHAIVIIPQQATFTVSAAVSDANIQLVQKGQRVTATPTGATESVSGTLTSVAPQATVSSGVATFAVTATLDASPLLHAGAGATLSIIVAQDSGVLTVPTSAVHTNGGSSTVQVLVNGLPQTRSVTVGASDATLTEIVQGVNPGDNVIIATVSSSIPSSGSGSGRSLFGGGGGGGGFRSAGGGGGGGGGPVFAGG